jgi:hypothetical protein
MLVLLYLTIIKIKIYLNAIIYHNMMCKFLHFYEKTKEPIIIFLIFINLYNNKIIYI